MNETTNVKGNECIPFKVILELVDTAIFTTTGKHLSNAEIIILQGSWQGEKYSQIANQHGYTLEYLKNDIAPKLWKRLSEALGEKVSKANLRAVLYQRYQQEQRTQQPKVEVLAKPSAIAHQQSLAQQDASAFHLISTPRNLSGGVETTKPNLEARFVGLNNIDNSLPNLIKDSQSPVTDHAPNIVKLPQHPYHNLPAPEQMALVNRQAEVKRLLECLVFEHPTPRIGVVGIGGAGKTTLVLDVAHRCLQASQNEQSGKISREILPRFEAIIFTSAKRQHFTTCGILPRYRREHTLQDIFTRIAHTLKCRDITPFVSIEEACERIHSCLAKVRTLLIIDNLDTFEDQQAVLGFLYELPSTVKVVVTSRESTPFTAINLAGLPPTEALNLIQQQAREKDVKLSLGNSQQLYQITGGFPAAIIYAISQLATGYTVQDVSACLLKSKGEFSRFYLESTVQPLRGQPTHQLLLALAMFPKPPVREAVCAAACVTDSIAATEGLVRLQQLSLIQHQQGRYTLLPLVRGYVLAELMADSEFECLARKQWMHWYLNFVREQGGEDGEWNNYQLLEQEWENITEVMDWCIARNQYSETCQFWREMKSYIYSLGCQQSRLAKWKICLIWLDWLIQAAQTRKHWSTIAEMIGDRAWILTLMGQPQCLAATEILFTQAWELRCHQAVNGQVELATRFGAWHIQQQQFTQATQWLNRAQALLDNPQLDPALASRHSLQILYYQGEIYYKTGDYEESKRLFQQIVHQAQAIGWRRIRFLATSFLANMAIKQGRLDQAQQLLKRGIAKESRERCCGYTSGAIANSIRLCPKPKSPRTGDRKT